MTMAESRFFARTRPPQRRLGVRLCFSRLILNVRIVRSIYTPPINVTCPSVVAKVAKRAKRLELAIRHEHAGWRACRSRQAREKKKRMVENNKDDPVSRCQPGGIVKLHTTPLLKRFIQIPGLLVTLNEMDATYRQIFMDGRPLPEVDLPSAKGYSVGKWDGDTLVVTTKGFKDGLWLDRQGTPMSDAATMTERFQRVNYGNIYIEITVDDPKTYTALWTVKLHHQTVLDTELIDYLCVENEKDVAPGHMVGK